MNADHRPIVRLATVHKRKSSKGNEYFSGFMGDAMLLLFRDSDADSDRWGEAWKVLVQERPRKRADGGRP